MERLFQGRSSYNHLCYVHVLHTHQFSLPMLLPPAGTVILATLLQHSELSRIFNSDGALPLLCIIQENNGFMGLSDVVLKHRFSAGALSTHRLHCK